MSVVIELSTHLLYKIHYSILNKVEIKLLIASYFYRTWCYLLYKKRTLCGQNMAEDCDVFVFYTIYSIHFCSVFPSDGSGCVMC